MGLPDHLPTVLRAVTFVNIAALPPYYRILFNVLSTVSREYRKVSFVTNYTAIAIYIL